MSVLHDLLTALNSSRIEIVDLTAPLRSTTPVLQLPEPFSNTINFRLEEISRYDDRGPAWYWNDIHTGEHTGTHFDAPVHWVTAKDGEDISQVGPERLIAPAVVLDFAAQAGQDPDFLLEIEHVRASRWNVPSGSPNRPRSSGSGWRPSARTPARPTGSTRRSRATPTSSARASTG
jgi:Putative cyclase